MFGLVRFAVSLVMFAAFVWFAVTVPLGKRTLWGHLHAIFATQEAKDLAEGTKEEAERVARKVKDELQRPDMARDQAPSPSKPVSQHEPPVDAPPPSKPASPREAPAARQHRVKVPLR